MTTIQPPPVVMEHLDVPRELATWRSPTASLLRAPDAEVLSPSPLLSSVLDGATNSAIPRKGD